MTGFDKAIHSWSEDDQYTARERAAIHEHDGKADQLSAERMAWVQVDGEIKARSKSRFAAMRQAVEAEAI